MHGHSFFLHYTQPLGTLQLFLKSSWCDKCIQQISFMFIFLLKLMDEIFCIEIEYVVKYNYDIYLLYVSCKNIESYLLKNNR